MTNTRPALDLWPAPIGCRQACGAHRASSGLCAVSEQSTRNDPLGTSMPGTCLVELLAFPGGSGGREGPSRVPTHYDEDDDGAAGGEWPL